MSEQVALIDHAPEGATPEPRRGRGVRAGRLNRWSRLFHVYVSMGCMLLVAFFALTGLTLNHPSWSLGSTTTTSHDGALPAGSVHDGTVDYLAVSEYVRDAFGVSGRVKDYGTVGDIGHIDYAGPGYSANATFSLTSSSLNVSITQGDLLAVLNDIHKGRDTSDSWGWAIDASALLLLTVVVTGIAIQVFQRKRRRSAMLTVAGFSMVTALVLVLVAH